jgi:hypothetical protein
MKSKPAKGFGDSTAAFHQPGSAGTAGPTSGKKKTLPGILFESEALDSAVPGGPGERYALGPTPLSKPVAAVDETPELPASYGTERLILLARDPHSLYAAWDISPTRLGELSSLSTDGRLALRVYGGLVGGQPESEIEVHPDSQHWFIHVREAGSAYTGELGYYAQPGEWVSVAVSGTALTPPDTISTDTSYRVASLDLDGDFFEILAEADNEGTILDYPFSDARGQLELALSGGKGAQTAGRLTARWTPEQAKALADVVSMEDMRRVWFGSLESAELARRKGGAGPGGLDEQFLDESGGPGHGVSDISSMSGQAGAAAPPREFWFNINAELVIYGATEPGAEVRIGGRPVKLRPDGTFSFRYALPDGQFELPLVALSADRKDGRGAEMRFSRQTNYRGDVGAHPQDPNLKPPSSE